MANKIPRVVRKDQIVSDEPKEDFLSHDEIFDLMVGHEAIKYKLLEEKKLHDKTAYIQLEIENKNLQIRIKQLELQLHQYTIESKQKEVSCERDTVNKIREDIKKKYGIEGNFGFNTDTGLIIKE